MRAPSPAFRRYLALELPGAAVAAVAIWAAVEYVGLEPWLGAGLLALWVAKDLVLYPFVRHAYESGDPHPSAALAGRTAKVATRLDPRGYVRLGAERWRAELTGGGSAEVGDSVRVLGVEGLTLQVERAE